jgi:hypothetical protein
MGLWDLERGDGGLVRVLHGPMLEALRRAQRLEGWSVADGRRRPMHIHAVA